MRARRTTVLAAVAFGACVLLPLGAVLLVLGRTGDRGALSVAGIVVGVAGATTDATTILTAFFAANIRGMIRGGGGIPGLFFDGKQPCWR